MLEEQRAPSGAEPVGREAEAPLAVAPQGAASRPVLSRLFVSRQVVPRDERAAVSVYTDPFTWAIALATWGAYAVLSLFRLMRLNPSSWDLGIYTEYVKQYAHLAAPIVDIRAAGFNLLGDHFQPIVAVLAPFFRLFPSSATLLIAQSLLTALSVFPVSQVAREKLGVGPGRAIAVAYGFSWGLQQLAQFDFHEIAFSIPLLAFSLSALVRGHIRATVWWALPLVFVKEDQGFTVAAIGLYLVITGIRAKAPDLNAADGVKAGDGLKAAGGVRAGDGLKAAGGVRAGDGLNAADGVRAGDGLNAADGVRAGDGLKAAGDSKAPDGRVRIAAGLFLIFWGLAWSFLAIGVIIPHFNPAHHYYYWSDGGVFAPGGHPSVAGLARQLFRAWPDKLLTVMMLLLPTAFIALRSPVALIAVPSLLLRFMSTDSSFWGTYWHYNATVMPILFIAAIDALARIGAEMDADDASAGRASWASGRQGLWRATLAGARRYGAAMMLAIAIPLAFQFPLSQLWNAQTYRISPHVAAADVAMAQVPDGATVQTTLDLLAPLAARTDTFWIGNSGNPETQYIVFDGLDSNYTPAIKNVPAFIASVYPHHVYTQIFSSGDVYVFRRTS